MSPSLLTNESRNALVHLLTAEIVARNYGVNVQISVEESSIMQGLNITISVPGQSRMVYVKGQTLIAAQTVHVNEKSLIGAKPEEAYEQICEDVLFAVYQLLDKDEDDD